MGALFFHELPAGSCAAIPFMKPLITKIFAIHDSRLTTQVSNLQFKNPVGLGAGFDKNAKYLRELEALGFGFVEIGTVTPLPQAGNEKPRLFRLPKDKALINRMGFNNDGVKVVAERLKKWKEQTVGVELSRLQTPDSPTHHWWKYWKKQNQLPMKMPGKIMKSVLKNCILMLIIL